MPSVPPWRNGRRSGLQTHHLGRYGGSSPPGGTIYGPISKLGRKMASKKADMQKLQEQRSALLREIEALRNKVAGLEMAMQLLDDDAPKQGEKTSRKSGVKNVLLDLLEDVGTTGLNAATAVQLAANRNIVLDRGTVSSLLSRFKRDGVVEYDGERYRLKKYASYVQAAQPQAEIPSVGIAQAAE